jgi:hypothetical protein
MELLGWIVLAALATATVVWLVRRFTAENRKIDEILRDFDRDNPRSEPALVLPRRLAALRRRP